MPYLFTKLFCTFIKLNKKGPCINSCVCILNINENATLVFSISFRHGLVNQNIVFIIHF